MKMWWRWWWWKKTVEMWWWWWWCRENSRNVVVAVVVLEQNNGILWPENLYKCSTFFLFLSLHSAPEELTWVGSVPFAKNPLVEKIVCKGMWCLNTARLVSPHFKQFQCLNYSIIIVRRTFGSGFIEPLNWFMTIIWGVLTMISDYHYLKQSFLSVHFLIGL